MNFVNGIDVAGQRRDNGTSCRIYSGERSVPEADEIIKRLAAKQP
jgi:hypothetical protein